MIATEALDQIVSRGDVSIAQIEQKIAALTQRSKTAKMALEDLHKEREARLHQIDSIRSTIARLQDSYDQSVRYAEMARDTTQEQQSIKAVSTAKKELSSAKKELVQTEARNAEAEKQELAREQELTRILDSVPAEQEKLQSDLRNVQAAHRRAHQQLGEQKYDAFFSGYEQHHKRVDELKRQLVEAQTELLDCHEQGMQELAAWPDLQRKARNLQPPDSPTIRMLTGTMCYIDLLLANADHVTPDIPSIPWSFWETLTIPSQQMRGAPGQLEERRKKLEQILSVYREYIK